MKRYDSLTPGQGKWSLHPQTSQTGPLDWSDRSHTECEEKDYPEYPGEFPEYPSAAQSIRAEIQTIRELIMKKF